MFIIMPVVIRCAIPGMPHSDCTEKVDSHLPYMVQCSAIGARYHKVESLVGPDFFDYWKFYSGPDPTHGTVEAPVSSHPAGFMARRRAALRLSSQPEGSHGRGGWSPALPPLGIVEEF
jgi:hypothetical protein